MDSPEKHPAGQHSASRHPAGLTEMVEALVELDEEKVFRLLDGIVNDHLRPDELTAVLEECQKAMTAVGERFSRGDYFVAELIFAGEIMERVVGEIGRHLPADARANLGRVVLGTVEGDVHDIGKNIARSLLEASGFEVIDLGVNVPPERFVREVERSRPEIVGISFLLTTAQEAARRTILALREQTGAVTSSQVSPPSPVPAGSPSSPPRIIIGGAAVNDLVCREIEADAFTRGAPEGVEICKGWVARK